MERIIIEKVSKKIKNTYVFQDVDFVGESGSIIGLIGRNGAGKTMLIKCICGLSQYTEGTITVNGKVVGKDVEIPESVGVIIEVPGFLSNISGFGNLQYLADISGKVKADRINEVLKIVGLNPADKKQVSKYSLGMKQRLGIAQAILEDPDILLLDEPMNGLDNNGVADIKKLLLDMKKNDKTIVLASHHMEDIDELCDKVYVMDNGRIVKSY